MTFPTPRDALQGNPPTPDYRPRKADLVSVLDQMQTIAAVEMLKDFHASVGDMPAVGNATGDKRAVLQPAASGGGVYRWTGTQWELVAALPLSLTDSISAQEAAESLAQTILQAQIAVNQAMISGQQATLSTTQAGLSAARAAEALASEQQSEINAIASNYRPVSVLPTLPSADHPINGYVVLQTGPGGQLHQNQAGSWVLIGWATDPKFDTVPQLQASPYAKLGSVGQIVEAEGFRYKVEPVLFANPHILTNGGVKLSPLFAHGLDPRQLGAPADGVADDAPFVEKAFLITKTVHLGTSGTYRFASVIGIPNGGLYEPEAWNIIGLGARVVLDGVAAGDSIITSASAKITPESTANLFTGTVNIVGVNFTQTSSSVLMNGDRIYNMIVKICRFDQVTSVVRSYRPKDGGFPNGYIQSLILAHNHFSEVTKIVDAKRAFNFRWDHNFAEACGAGIYIDGADDAACVAFSMIGGVFEGGGLAVRLGKVLSGSVKDVYFEANDKGDAALEKCDILIGVNGGRSQGFLVEVCTFQPTAAQRSDAAYASIKDNAPATQNGSIIVIGSHTTGTRLFVPGQVRMQMGNGIGNGTVDAFWNSRAPLPAQNAGVSFDAQSGNRLFSAINDAGNLRVASIDVTEIINRVGSNSFASGTSGEIHVDMRFRTVGGIQTGAAKAVIDFITMGAAGGITLTPVQDVYASFTLRSFLQIAAGQPIETNFGNVTRAHFGTPELLASRSGNLYTLRLSTFAAGASMANYGPATNVDITVTTHVNGRRTSSPDFAPNVLPSL